MIFQILPFCLIQEVGLFFFPFYYDFSFKHIGWRTELNFSVCLGDCSVLLRRKTFRIDCVLFVFNESVQYLIYQTPGITRHFKNANLWNGVWIRGWIFEFYSYFRYYFSLGKLLPSLWLNFWTFKVSVLDIGLFNISFISKTDKIRWHQWLHYES